MKRKRTSEMNASISLESALVMPVVIYVILISFYFLLFMYNRSVCQDAALLAARQTLYCEDETNLRIERAVADKCKEALLDRLVGVKDIRVTVSTGRFCTKVNVMARMWFSDTPVMAWTVPFGEINVVGCTERFQPVEFFYTMDKLKYLNDWIKERKENGHDSGIQEGHES